MNVERVFNSLKEDGMKDAVAIICSESETRGYTVHINSRPMSADDLSDKGF